MLQPMECGCCRGPLRAGLAEWHFYCPACRYETASLAPSINDEAHPVKPDEVEREAGLKVLRRRNFARIIDQVRRLCAVDCPRLLDVGCAHGLFLEMVVEDFDAQGIEPHREVARQTRARGFKVREGYFPDALEAADRFDVIVFNDVLEHIPDLPAVFKACHGCLTEQGILVINLPDASVFVAPIRMGSGTRVKILQAMAMGIPVVSTTVGCEGIDAKDNENICIADSPNLFREKIVRLLNDKNLRDRIAQGGRELVEKKYSHEILKKKLFDFWEELETDIG